MLEKIIDWMKIENEIAREIVFWLVLFGVRILENDIVFLLIFFETNFFKCGFRYFHFSSEFVFF